MEGKLDYVKALVELGLDINTPHDPPDRDKPDSPFYQPEGAIVEAAGEGQLEVVRWMLEHGARINYVVHEQPRCLPLEWAAAGGHLEVVKLLVEHGADLHAVRRGYNAITYAEDYGHLDVRDYLHSLGARTMRETTPPDYASAHKRFLNHLVQQFGPLARWRLEIPGDPLVALHVIPASKKSAEQTLFTLGLSDHRLPQGRYEHACAELWILLPADWPVSDAALQDPQWNWPVLWLKRLACELRAAPRMPDPPIILMNGDPPSPLAPNMNLCGWLCLKSLENSVQAPDYRWISIHSLFPIYAEEAALVQRSGHEELVNRFESSNVPLYIDPKRPNMASEQ
jgi:hypothetical protein